MTKFERFTERSIFSAAEKCFRTSRFFRHPVTAEAGAHPLRGLWLTRRSLIGDKIDPFKSIMDIADKDEARRLIAATGKRFNGDYIEYRARIEAWMRAEVQKAGGNANENVSPLYFKLAPSPAPARPLFVTINIPADSIPADQLSFTIDDSFHNYALMDPLRKDNSPLENPPSPRVLDAHEMRTMIDRDGFPGRFDGGTRGRYIEAQVWSQDTPVFTQVRALLASDEMQQEVVTIKPGA